MENALLSYNSSGILDEQLLCTKQGVIVVQLQLMAPGHDSKAKWVIFDPLSRRSFLFNLSSLKDPGSDLATERLTGGSRACKASISDTVKVLTLASNGGVRLSELVKDGIIAHTDTVKSMVSAGIIQPQSSSSAVFTSFTDLYHRLVFDYPFHDYFDPQWREKDEAAMAEYKAAWPPPEPLTNRQGESFPLPAPSDPELIRSDRAGCFDLTFLGALLHKTLGVIEHRQRPVVGPVVRKTSPSGGCRHPSEIVVILPQGLESVPRGAYYYDVSRHQLVAAPAYAGCAESVSGLCGFILTSRVERAMWRYRDPRSYRAIPLDAGHIAETLLLLLGLRNLECAVSKVGSLTAGNMSWYEEPELAFISVGSPGISHHTSAKMRSDGSEESFLVNPSLYLTFEHGHICAHALWPYRRSAIITHSELQFIAERLPDRTANSSDRSKYFQDTSLIASERLKEFLNIGLLLAEPAATSIYACVKHWSRYGWYLTLLAHLEVMAAQVEVPNLSKALCRAERLDGIPRNRLMDALARRNTCRAFSPSPVPEETLVKILRETLTYGFDDCASLGARLRVFLCPLAVSGIRGSVHEWSIADGTLHPTDIVLDRQQVRHMTIGQECVSRAAAIVWMFVELPENDPANYELILLMLGRLGQRLCLLATNENLGIFMTPAVSDALIFETLGIPRAERQATYAFGLGHRENAAK